MGWLLGAPRAVHPGMFDVLFEMTCISTQSCFLFIHKYVGARASRCLGQWGTEMCRSSKALAAGRCHRHGCPIEVRQRICLPPLLLNVRVHGQRLWLVLLLDEIKVRCGRVGAEMRLHACLLAKCSLAARHQRQIVLGRTEGEDRVAGSCLLKATPSQIAATCWRCCARRCNLSCLQHGGSKARGLRLTLRCLESALELLFGVLRNNCTPAAF